jgi:hypothetical protein
VVVVTVPAAALPPTSATGSPSKSRQSTSTGIDSCPPDGTVHCGGRKPGRSAGALLSAAPRICTVTAASAVVRPSSMV